MSDTIASLMVRWMSGLVTGLQNRLQRFESASDLKKPFYKHLWRGFLFFTPFFTPSTICISDLARGLFWQNDRARVT